jgi:hypothetical protein
MSSNVTSILASPYLLYSTSITSFILARLIISHVKKHGPISFTGRVTKYNSIVYSIASLILCIAITVSIWTDISQTPNLSINSVICSPSRSDYDLTLRYIYHASKIYEYVDIFNVLASGGIVNAHFGVHHFTTAYLTYARVFLYPVGWKVFAFLNTFHHAFMYAYFGGASVFSEILPVTGVLQLAVGILGELYVIWSDCAGEGALWANYLAVGLLGTYAVLFAGDLRERGKEEDVERVGEKVE